MAACADVIATGLEQAFALANLQGVPADAQGNARLRRTEPGPLGQVISHVDERVGGLFLPLFIDVCWPLPGPLRLSPSAGSAA